MDKHHLALEELAALAKKNTVNLSNLAAKSVACQKFIEAALPYLTAAQSVEISRAFREKIEDVMALMDDVALPAEYHSTLLEKTNELLDSLAARRA
ncbi:hypothetical protein FAZ69_28715 [Trinickia terrae]|uniref:Uncharacterized protein n=1 Tax=Trinickia terrae TaxID=2571161 RepID=A0A4U1HMD7_9BURK|nr:hypothetical protein [Trinickia terrae]TKC81313.1 hypothetical protein FAZ69_28715 [Trinickia terrae]